MGEEGLRMLADVIFQLVPVPLVITDLLAAGTDREHAAQRFFGFPPLFNPLSVEVNYTASSSSRSSSSAVFAGGRHAPLAQTRATVSPSSSRLRTRFGMKRPFTALSIRLISSASAGPARVTSTSGPLK